jgi:hypothetical protein
MKRCAVVGVNVTPPRPTRGLRAVTTPCVAKHPCVDFLWAKESYVKTDAYEPPSPPTTNKSNKIPTFFDIKQ